MRSTPTRWRPDPVDGAPGDIRTPFEAPPAEGAAMEVADGVLWMRLPLPMVLNHVNVYALDDGDGWSLVDTGFHTARAVAIWERLLDGPLRGRPVRRVILTHHHPDHVGMAGWFAARGAEVCATRVAWLTARMLTLDVQDRPTPEQTAFWRAAGMPEEELLRRRAERPFNFADVVHPIPLGFTRLEEGAALRLGGRDWRVRLGDGHAPRHATLWSEDGALVLAGDQILPGISPNLGVYPTEPDADPVGEWLESCRRLSGPATEAQLCLPGHKLPFRGIPARLAQLVENHRTALDRLHAHLARPRTAHDCFPALYRREIGPQEYGLALVEAVGHLNHLARTGRALRQGTPDGRWLWRAA